MKTHLSRVLNDFEQHLSHLSLVHDKPLKCYEKSVQYIDLFLKDLKLEIVSQEFKNKKEEIYFFKHIKPHIVSKRILNKMLYEIESKKTTICNKTLVEYYQRELLKLQFFFEDNTYLCVYYLTENTDSDKLFFRRNKNKKAIHQDSFSTQFDPLFSTSHDYKFAEIIAFEALKLFLQQKLSELTNFNPKNVPYEIVNNLLIWSESKSKLIQLVYALHILKVFNKGQVDIKEIAIYFERVFHIELGDIYGAFMKMKKRKKPFKFIKELGKTLLKINKIKK